MSEPKEPYKMGKRKRMSVTSATAIKTLCQAIETAHENGALFFLAHAVLRGGRVPTTSKELGEAMREAARWLQKGD